MMHYSTPRFTLLFFISLALFSCTRTITTYTPADNEVQWVKFDKSSEDGATFFISTENDSLWMLARTEVSTTVGEIGALTLVDVQLKDVEQIEPGMTITIADNNGNTREVTATDWLSGKEKIGTLGNMSDTTAITLTCEKRFVVSSFPPEVDFAYSISVRDTVIAGTVRFKAVERAADGVMRWH
jgi:hypothetical protein